ncbi:Werner Syndrome-like exonuclease [Pseudolycoriella hygida]|uniref:3'-5' exonuclease n=1 Tax=Pseudolycoriella hygida TaxID=35572 RepID=A0A9Q0N510_9DIPT|nr:Werner Syndrome-like exonuclease [Pseudolycoriella hygida]
MLLLILLVPISSFAVLFISYFYLENFDKMPRRLPDWLKQLEKKSSPPKGNTDQVIPKIENTNDLSNDPSGKNDPTSKENNEAQPHNSLRSRDPDVYNNENKNEDNDVLSNGSDLPFVDYKGRIEYYTDFYDIAIASDTLTKWVDQQGKDVVPIAFDMEWPFTFQTGSGKSAVIQLCADVNLCYIFHISQLKKLPAALVHLLQHPKVRLHGVNIRNDCRKLERDYKEVNSQLMIDQCIDLGVWCNEIINASGRWSMARLVLHICKLQINKDRKVRMSKWHIQPLTKEQQLYAAIDVYIAQVMYIELEKRKHEKMETEKAFIEKYGVEAYNLVMRPL